MIFESMINDPMNGKNTQRKIDHTHTHIYTDIHAGKPFARERDRSFSFSSPIIYLLRL